MFKKSQSLYSSQLFFYSLFFFIDKKVNFYISFVHERFLRVITIQDFLIVRVATQMAKANVPTTKSDFAWSGYQDGVIKLQNKFNIIICQGFKHSEISLTAFWITLNTSPYLKSIQVNYLYLYTMYTNAFNE